MPVVHSWLGLLHCRPLCQIFILVMYYTLPTSLPLSPTPCPTPTDCGYCLDQLSTQLQVLRELINSTLSSTVIVINGSRVTRDIMQAQVGLNSRPWMWNGSVRMGNMVRLLAHVGGFLKCGNWYVYFMDEFTFIMAMKSFSLCFLFPFHPMLPPSPLPSPPLSPPSPPILSSLPSPPLSLLPSLPLPRLMSNITRGLYWF